MRSAVILLRYYFFAVKRVWRVRSQLTALAECSGVSVSMCYVSDFSAVCLDCVLALVLVCVM